ncbi:MAG: thiazole synthase, partial [Mesorhizobium sp.]
VLLNTAVAKAADPIGMARAFGKAVDAGREAYRSGLLEPRDLAVPSTPTIGRAVFQ